MAINENGNLLDDAGNVVVDFVWGNIPMQPNDVREENGQTELLDPTLDNHRIAYENWNGYPLYIPGTAGAEGAGYIIVPSVLGQTTTNATDILEDDGLVVTVAAGATNAAKVVTAAARTAGSTTVTITASGAAAAYPVGTKITITNSGDTTVNGTWTVTGGTSDTVTFTGTATTVLSLSGITGAVVGTVATIKTQSVAAGANSIAVGAAITITPWAIAS